jgi:hypothetical protein
MGLEARLRKYFIEDFPRRTISLPLIATTLIFSHDARAENDNKDPEKIEKEKNEFSPDPTEKELREIRSIHNKVFFPKHTYRTTSLPEATFYSGLPALLGSIGWFAHKLRNEKSGQSWEYFKRAWKNPAPKPDNNPGYVNYFFHPLFGAEAYLICRNRGCTVFESFLYSSAASVTWEYLIEPWVGGHPSTQDLAITSTVGSAFGELRHFCTEQLLGMSNRNTFEDFLLIFCDPQDAIYRMFDEDGEIATSTPQYFQQPRLKLPEGFETTQYYTLDLSF